MKFSTVRDKTLAQISVFLHPVLHEGHGMAGAPLASSAARLFGAISVALACCCGHQTQPGHCTAACSIRHRCVFRAEF